MPGPTNSGTAAVADFTTAVGLLLLLINVFADNHPENGLLGLGLCISGGFLRLR